MTFHYMGKFSGNVDDLPESQHEEGCVKFKEPDSPKKLALIANGISLIIYVFTLILYFWRAGGLVNKETYIVNFSFLGLLACMITLVPHELIHAICFKEDVYMYTNLKQGMLFVWGPERMSKARFIFMSMLPNLLFGFIPFVIFLLFADPANLSPVIKFLGTLGAFAIPMGAGDYMNVFNSLTQMPRGAKCYMHKFNTYWYMP